MLYLKQEHDAIDKALTSGKPVVRKNVKWLLGLRVGDIIHTTHEDETLEVVRENLPLKNREKRAHNILVKRKHLKEPVHLKECFEFEDHVEIIWCATHSYVQEDYSKWVVKREGIEINPEVLYTLFVEKENDP